MGATPTYKYGMATPSYPFTGIAPTTAAFTFTPEPEKAKDNRATRRRKAREAKKLKSV